MTRRTIAAKAEKPPTYQDICGAFGVLDNAGFGTDEVRVLSSADGTLVLRVPKELVVSNDPDKVTLASHAILLAEGESVTVNTTAGAAELEPHQTLDVIDGLLSGDIATFPPLNEEEIETLTLLEQGITANVHN
ncbi:hypothetical protein A3F37_00695 [Candidatus Saccharibacteria bacterium RIFCSPHIGHO2_12_FULL_41_12]|nr:MAG: hypothetical protein A3F37_00695 [Candidatus Saccharibacteria bacterium RIFCSPHIGHO2_12_FULL_41_12]